MTQAILLGGLGFGDEGKGATVDYLTRYFGADTVFRYNGGHQAGHRVELPGGTSHVFSQFGSGYFAGAFTHHTKHSIIEPGAMVREANHLKAIFDGDPFKRISVDPRCLVTPRYLKLLNRVEEEARDNPHGSCGVGIGVTKSYYLTNGLDSIFAHDLDDEELLTEKLELMRTRVLNRLQSFLPRRTKSLDTLMRLRPSEEAAWLSHESRYCKIEKHPSFEVAIFEGAQGILLDERCGFHPHTTWSDITFRWAHEFLLHYPHTEKLRVGVTRCYHTRHGNGPFPSENDSMINTPMIHPTEEGNQDNEWQGGIRYGWLDLVLLKYGIQCLRPDYIVVNHLDQFPAEGYVVTEHTGTHPLEAEFRNLKESEQMGKAIRDTGVVTRQVDREGLLAEINKLGKVALIGEGPTWEHRRITREMKFRD